MVHCIYGGVAGYNIQIKWKIDFVYLANSVDPDEMLLCAAIHLGLNCLSEILMPCRSFQSPKG